MAVVYLVAGLGHARDRLTRALLGPTAATRLAAMHRQATVLAARDELSQQVHDSVGHALTLNAMQASAAARLLADRPEFAREMLEAIQTTSADALRDLDQVLAQLRAGGDPAAGTDTPRTLADLDDLLASARAAGTTIDAEFTGSLGALPEQVSHTAYRIVREGLTNVLRHTGPVPVRLAIAIRGGELDLELTNPLDAARSQAGTGSGLAALRERVTAQSGTMSAAPHDGQWRIAVRIPWREVE